MSKTLTKRSKQASSKTATTQIPTPFVKAPDTLEPFLAQLDPAQIYITHIDRNSPEYKRQIFLIPVFLNGFIALLLAWRVYVAAPQYFALAQTFFGYTSSATVDTDSTTRKEQIWILLRRTFMMGLDFLLFRFIGPWPLTFFLEQPSNPVHWRWRLGFLHKEVVVRVSRNWGNEDLMKGVKQGEENPFFKTRVLPAIEKQFMDKTGYLMMGSSWDLDFELMLDAHFLVKQEKVKMADLDKLVLANMEGIGWVVWQWESSDDAMEDRRRKIVAFKEKLTALGKESLFWKWTDIVEAERDTDGGFTAEKQQKVAAKVQAEFEKSGVDFEAVVKSIGGLEDLPRKES